MRSIFAGLFILLLAANVFAQTKGEVESIGFGGTIRPDCWTPMVVRLRPGTLDPGTYQIQVEQKDEGEDTQVFTRTITVNAEDQSREQRFWMYFLPQPTDHGLPDLTTGASLRDLNTEMKVWLCTDSGKQIEPLPITSGISNVDAIKGRPVGRKFILCVSDGSDKPNFTDYSVALGATEDVDMVVVRPEDLPESVLGLDSVDGVVWMSGDASLLSRGGSRRMAALTEYIRLGGKLIVTQPAERARIEALEPLLPIKLKDAAGNWLIEMRNRTTLAPLRDWAKPKMPANVKNPWMLTRTVVRVAHASAVQPGAMVSATIDWNDDSATAGQPDVSPYLVRWGVGLGEVTWVAQNLGDISLTSQIPAGWMGVWDKVLDLKNDPRLLLAGRDLDNDAIRESYDGGMAVNLGRQLTAAMEHNARGTTLIVVAIGFFVIYWVLSGPVSYFVLANKKRKGLSWPIFAAAALAATVLTVGVVRIVLGGGADIHHITFVRLSPGQPAIVESRLGVYLTKSSSIPITLGPSDPAFVSYVSSFAPHPQLIDDTAGGFIGKERYTVPLPESGSAETIEISVPFRSTLKKLQARWVGQLPGLDGAPKLIEATEESPQPRLTGKITNSIGRDLSEVYFAFVSRSADGAEFVDHVFYLPKWAKDGQLDLDKELTANKVSTTVKYQGIEFGARPGDGKIIGDTITANAPRRGPAGGLLLQANDRGWSAYWNDSLRANSASGPMDPTMDSGYRLSFPMTSLFDRLAIVARAADGRGRYDLLRYGGRHFDMSQSMSAGELVILAQDAANNYNGQTASPLPFPIEVDHDKIAGTGVTFYQVTLPLTRVEPAPATQPATPAVDK